MGYLGNNPKGNLLTMNSSQFSGDNSNTNFTLSQTVGNTNEIEVFVGNVDRSTFSLYCIRWNNFKFYSYFQQELIIFMSYIGKSLVKIHLEKTQLNSV